MNEHDYEYAMWKILDAAVYGGLEIEAAVADAMQVIRKAQLEVIGENTPVILDGPCPDWKAPYSISENQLRAEQRKKVVKGV